MKTLKDLNADESGIITGISEINDDVLRLMSMGLVVGAEIKCEGLSLGGDPKFFSLYGSQITARNNTLHFFNIS
jgi:Fe2+ transport system protein FeoA